MCFRWFANEGHAIGTERREVAIAWTLFIGGLFVYVACIWITQAIIAQADAEYEYNHKRPGPEARWAREAHSGVPPEFEEPDGATGK